MKAQSCVNDGPAGVARGRLGSGEAIATGLLAAILVLAGAGTAGAQASAGVVTEGGSGAEAEAARASTVAAERPGDSFPPNAAGWGPEAGRGRFVSRWAEDWTDRRAAGTAPVLKAVPLRGGASLTMSAEARLRFDSHSFSPSAPGDDLRQGLFRGVIGADLRLSPYLRAYGEVGTGQVEGRRRLATANFQNDASLQQLFVDVRGEAGSTLAGAMIGRQEFADGPRQLLSVGDGPNIHRTWNGVRLYAHGRRLRVGAYDLKLTRPGRDAFDEEVGDDERIRGINGSIVVSAGEGGSSVYLDPFWIRSENRSFRSGGATGIDDRDTWGARLWGRRGDWKFDWTVARQSGRFDDRPIDAWGLFAVQSVALSSAGWKPRLGAHIDLASGGGAYGSGHLESFNQLYASSGYLGEGRFLSTSNLILVAPGIALSPSPATSLSVEYGFAWRMTEDDTAYAGGMRPYPGTETVSGHEIGGLLRVAASWTAAEHLTLFCGYEYLVAGDVLERAGRSSAAYAYAGATYRY